MVAPSLAGWVRSSCVLAPVTWQSGCMPAPQLYDRIGVGYAAARRPDPYIAQQVLDALGDATTVVNIGAGTGNYEPVDRPVVAVEPNAVMVAQRTSPVPVVRAFAEALPFADDSFDADFKQS